MGNFNIHIGREWMIIITTIIRKLKVRNKRYVTRKKCCYKTRLNNSHPLPENKTFKNQHGNKKI